MDASITGAVLEVQQCSLRRSTASAVLVAQLLAASQGNTSTAGSDRELWAETGQQQAAVHGRGRADGDRQALAAAAAAAGSSSWVDVLSLDANEQQAERPTASKETDAQQQTAVSLRYFNTAVAAPDSARGSATRPPGSTSTLRCSVALGRLLLAHAPGFVTHLAVVVGQYAAGAAAAAGAVQQPGTSAQQLSNRSDEPDDSNSPSSAGAGVSKAGGPAVATQPPEVSPALQSAEQPAEQAAAGSGSPSLLTQALQPQLALEFRVGRVELVALSSQAADAAAAVVLLRQLELRSGDLNWQAPWNGHLRSALLAPSRGELERTVNMDQCGAAGDYWQQAVGAGSGMHRAFEEQQLSLVPAAL